MHVKIVHLRFQSKSSHMKCIVLLCLLMIDGINSKRDISFYSALLVPCDSYNYVSLQCTCSSFPSFSATEIKTVITPGRLKAVDYLGAATQQVRLQLAVRGWADKCGTISSTATKCCRVFWCYTTSRAARDLIFLQLVTMEVLPRRLLLRCDSAFYPPSNCQTRTSSIELIPWHAYPLQAAGSR